MFYLQAPAGNNIKLPIMNYSSSIDEFFKPFHCSLYGNGTSALAAAIVATVKNKSIDQPEIILPAYACPDLISAIFHAKAIPVLCDLEPNSARVDVNGMEQYINEKTAAIIAVNLLGIVENNEKLRQLANKYQIILIEDSAQYFPKKIKQNSWFGDYIILSFGRGKPASILTGGAVLTKNAQYMASLPKTKASKQAASLHFVKAQIYNTLVNPYLYSLLDNMPGVNLGETNYKPLKTLAKFNDKLTNLLIHNLNNFQKIDSKLTENYQSILKNFSFIKDLYQQQSHLTKALPLRYPVLVETNSLRDKVYNALKSKGVGVSKMYKRPLNKIHGLKDLTPYENEYIQAENFSSRLLTLPTHNRINKKDLSLLLNTLNTLRIE